MSKDELYLYLNLLEESFSKNANLESSLKMSKYMRDCFPFFGISAPQRKNIQKNWFSSLPKKISDEDRRLIIRELWQKEQREFHYVAIDWMNSWNVKLILEEDKDLLKWLITNHSWWDSVDSIAANYLGKYYLQFPESGTQLIEEWRHEPNLWLNRSCLIFQLKFGPTCDFKLLTSIICQYQPVKEFFIQKAIGWSLRQFSKFQPEAVNELIQKINLKGLARKEASKYL